MLIIVNGDTRKRKRSPSTVAEHSKEKRLSLSKSKETPEERGFKEFVSNVFTLMSRYWSFFLNVAHIVVIQRRV